MPAGGGREKEREREREREREIDRGCHGVDNHTCSYYRSLSYRIAGKFGGELNLAVWRSILQPPKLKSAKISYSHIYIYGWIYPVPNQIRQYSCNSDFGFNRQI